MLIDWQNQHCENDYTSESNLYVQCNPYQNSNGIFRRDWKVNPQVHMKAQKTSNSQSNPEQKEQCWRYQNTWLQTILQSHSNENSVVWHKYRQENQWNRIEGLDANIYMYIQREREHYCISEFAQGNCGELGEEKRMTVNNAEMQCICVWRQYNEMQCKLLNNRW
jgi:hypothetical protein